MRRVLTTTPRIALAVLGTAAVVTACGQGVGAPSAAGGTGTVTTTQGPPVPSQRCPWATASALKSSSPSALGAEVVARMTLSEKLGLVNLANQNGYENQNTGVPRLCIPALTLQDSPNGIANGATQVTQLPASLGHRRQLRHFPGVQIRPGPRPRGARQGDRCGPGP